MTTTRCAARAIGSDQMHCPVCRLTWDTNDPQPPACGGGRLVRCESAPIAPRAPGWVESFVSGLSDRAR